MPGATQEAVERVAKRREKLKELGPDCDVDALNAVIPVKIDSTIFSGDYRRVFGFSKREHNRNAKAAVKPGRKTLYPKPKKMIEVPPDEHEPDYPVSTVKASTVIAELDDPGTPPSKELEKVGQAYCDLAETVKKFGGIEQTRWALNLLETIKETLGG